MSQKRTHRYPGVQPFQKEQAHLFFGRDEDTERLFDLILLEKLVVLFGKSGYGKSSLLNAGILPLLDKETAKGKRHYLPVRVRFNAWSETDSSLFDKFLFHLMSAIQADKQPRKAVLTGSDNIPETLWSLLKFSRPSSDTTFILIFDQFEEFFTYPEVQQQEFKRQLAEVLYADVPTYVKQNEDKHTPEEIAFLSEKMDVKTIFSIRADRMSDLDRLKDKLPAILHKRCELRALPLEETRKALIIPSELPGDFASSAFQFEPSAQKKILDFLRDAEGLVEPNQLQILAESFERRVISEGLRRFDAGNIGDLRAVIARYYSDKIAAIEDPTERLAVRRLCEEGLAQEGEPPIRLSLHAAQIRQFFGVETSLLARLVDVRLLRAEAGKGGGATYELPHDTLLGAVLEAKKVRVEEERREAAERAAAQREVELAAARAEAAREKRRRQRAAFLAWGAGLAAVVAIGLALFARQKMAEAEIERNKALQSDSLAQVAKKEAVEKAMAAQHSDSLAQVDKINAEQAKRIAQSAEFRAQEAFIKLNNEVNGKTYLFMNEIKNWEQRNHYILKLDEWKTKVDMLNFESYFLTTLPQEVYECKNLKALKLGDNSKMQWSEVLPKLKEIKSLKILELQENQISDLPKEFGEMKSLISLNLSSNYLSVLPPEIGGISDLATLDLSNNNLTALPPEIGKLKNLKSLNLHNNRVVKMPYEIKELNNLSTLDLSNNKLGVIPVEIGELKHLKTLFLFGNDLSTFPMEILKLNTLTLLDFRDNKLAILPPEIGELNNLTSLNLIGNKLTILPTEIVKLKELTSLALGNNKFTVLPTEIFDLTNLTKLDLSYTQLRTVPSLIGRLKNLTHLYLNGNQLKDLPLEIYELKNLKYLNLNGNPIPKPEQERIKQLLPPKCFINF